MTGMPYMARLAIGLRTPKLPVLGWDVAGTVDAVGSNVTGIQPGDEVMGTCVGRSRVSGVLTGRRPVKFRVESERAA
jgi:NADPH:quinone reductase-like Zn-dependent oxidoreductase